MACRGLLTALFAVGAAFIPVSGAAAAPASVPRFELVADLPWPAPTSPAAKDAAKETRHATPRVLLAPDGTPWLLTAERVYAILRLAPGRTAARWHALPLPEELSFSAAAPLSDGGAIVYGSSAKDRVNLLMRLDSSGAPRWRRSGPIDDAHVDLETLRGWDAFLISDASDGTVYLVARKDAGQLARIALDDGAITALAMDTAGALQLRSAVARAGVVHRVVVTQEPYAIDWLRRGAGGKSETTRLVDATYRLDLSRLHGVRADGAGLFGGRERRLAWVAPDGRVLQEVDLSVGVVRDGADLVVAAGGEDGLVATRWRAGKRIAARRLQVSGRRPRLLSASAAGYAVHTTGSGGATGIPDTIHSLGPDGVDVSRLPLSGAERDRALARTLYGLDAEGAVVAPDGSVYLVGVDETGAFLVRISQAR